MRKIFTFLFALVASVGMSWAGEVTIVFAANNNTKEVTVELPHTFLCSFDNEDGDLDYIIRELYEMPYGGFCYESAPTASGNAAVTAAIDEEYAQSITISNAFEGTAHVSGYYWKYTNANQDVNTAETITYYLTISVKAGTPAATTYALQLVADPEKGSVAVTNLLGSDIIDNGNGNYTVPENAEVTFLATPNEGYEFTGWKVGNIDEMVGCYYCGTALNTNDNPLTITMTEDIAYLAVFEAVAPAPAEVTVVFEANGKKKEVEIESFPHTFLCSFDDEDGDLDYIIRELYEMPYGGFCYESAPTASGNAAVTAAIDEEYAQSITISKAFEGTAIVSGYYWMYTNANQDVNTAETITYYLTISIKAGTPTAVENVQTNQVQATKFFRNGMLLIEKDGKIFNVQGAPVK